MYAREDGAGAKRNGVIPYLKALPEGNSTQLMYYVPVAGDIQVLAANDAGKIYVYDSETWTEIYSGLNTNGLIRWVHFAHKLIICNGFDPLLSWDGSVMSVIEEFITDSSANLTYVNSTTLTIDSEATLYAVGTTIKADLNGTEVESTVASVSGTTTITVTLNDAILTSDLSAVSYAARPLTFNYIYAAHDRLWGFGTGQLKASSYSNNVDRNRVYYTYGINGETKWHDSAGNLQSINLGDKIPVVDEILAMAVKDGLTVFFGKNYLQVWSGNNPTAAGNFSWNKTIPLGIAHGNLVIELPNDIAFFTRFGARTLSRTLQTEQLDVGDVGSEIEPTINDEIAALLADDASLSKAYAFHYVPQGWFGFKLGNQTLVFQFNGASQGWARFNGIFSSAQAFMNLPDGNLVMAEGANLLHYDETAWDDNSNNITTKWWTPWLNLSSSNKRWANKYIEVITEQGASQSISVKRYKNYNSSNAVVSLVDANVSADYWDEADWDFSLWDNGYPEPKAQRDHFIADTFSYSFETSNTVGPLVVYGFKVHGLRER